jgi:hypothetical protein
MPQARTARIVQFLLGCVLIVGSVVVLRLHQLSSRMLDGSLRPDEAVRTYRERVRATQVLLRTDRLIASR